MIKPIQSFFASSLLVIYSSVISVTLPLLMAMPSVVLFSQSAEAKTVPFILRKALACSITCEAIVVSQKTGNIYKVEYYDRIGSADGTEVAIEMDNYSDTWYKIINLINGKSSNIRSFQKIN